jgi:hypothetical protein
VGSGKWEVGSGKWEVGGGENVHRKTESHLQLATGGTTSARAIKSAFYSSNLNPLISAIPSVPSLSFSRTNPPSSQTVYIILNLVQPAEGKSKKGKHTRF